MPKKLALHLPNLTEAEREALYSSITVVAANPLGDPTRTGVIEGVCIS